MTTVTLIKDVTFGDIFSKQFCNVLKVKITDVAIGAGQTGQRKALGQFGKTLIDFSQAQYDPRLNIADMLLLSNDFFQEPLL